MIRNRPLTHRLAVQGLVAVGGFVLVQAMEPMLLAGLGDRVIAVVGLTPMRLAELGLRCALCLTLGTLVKSTVEKAWAVWLLIAVFGGLYTWEILTYLRTFVAIDTFGVPYYDVLPPGWGIPAHSGGLFTATWLGLFFSKAKRFPFVS